MELAGAPITIDGYELLASIAAGGMAEVFLARSLARGGSRLVAVKVLLPELCEDRRFVTMFVDEARVAVHLTHPNVVRLHDVGQSREGIPFLAMELVVGASVGQILRGGVGRVPAALPLPHAIEIMAQAAEGLASAHEARDALGAPLEIVHRDVSPQNILVGIDGHARIADFGIARAAARLTQSAVGEVKGKARYFAPEQARGLPVDHRADLFALGVVLWESLALRPLFVGASMGDIMRAVVSAPIPDVRELRPDVPLELSRVIGWALTRDVEARVASGRAWAEALRAVARRSGISPSLEEIGAYVRERRGPELEEMIARIERFGGLRGSSSDPGADFDDEATTVDAEVVRRIRRSRPDTGAMSEVDASSFVLPSRAALARAIAIAPTDRASIEQAPREPAREAAPAPRARPLATTLSFGASAPSDPTDVEIALPGVHAPPAPLVVPPTRVSHPRVLAPAPAPAPSPTAVGSAPAPAPRRRLTLVLGGVVFALALALALIFVACGGLAGLSPASP